MKISDVITKLEEIKKVYGEDMDVFISEKEYNEDYDGECDVDFVDVDLNSNHFKIEQITTYPDLNMSYYERSKMKKKLIDASIKTNRLILK